MLGLTHLGLLHTAISLVALLAGAIALARYGEILPQQRLGRIYIGMTVLSCLTGFGIFQHGGFGKPHLLGIATLLVLALAAVAYGPRLFGRAARYVETASYSVSFFFHWIPGTTETFTRLPLQAPLFANADDPALARLVALMFAVAVVGIGLQLRRLHADEKAGLPWRQPV